MSKQMESSRFILPSLGRVAEFYQHLLGGITTYEEIGIRSLRHIRVAHAFRQVERVRELSSILTSIPIREYRLIGQYYLVWCEFRESKCNDRVLEHVIDQSETYKSKALITRATFEVRRGKPESAIYLYTDALKATPTVSDYIVASRGIAHVKSLEGFHASALKDLERLIPLLRQSEPLTYYDVLNSYAVELLEVGRLREAKDLSLLVAMSPLSRYYAEWSETREEIERRGWNPPRSIVAFTQSARQTNNLVRLPLPELSDSLALQTPPASQPARVLSLQEWKERMPKKPNGDSQDKTPPRPTTPEEKSARLKELEKLTTREKLLMVMNVIGDERVGDDLLLKALIILEGLEPDENQGS